MGLPVGLLLSLPAIPGPAFADETPSVLVQTTTISKGSLPRIVNAYGAVEADPSARTSVTSPLAAVVGKVFVRPGQEVAKGGALVELTPNPQTSSSYTQAVTAAQNAETLLAHTQELYNAYLATKQDLANAKRTETDAKAALAAMKAQGAEGPSTVAAPFPAVVTTLSTSIGATVDVGTPLLDLAPPNSLVLRVGVVPGDAKNIKPGDSATIAPVGESNTFTGSVILRGSMVDTATGLVPVEISVSPDSIFPGQTARAAIETGSIVGYVVPHEAVLVDNKGSPYIVQTVAMKAKIVPVQVLGMHGDKNVIEGKVDLNAPLVLAGNYQLQDGMKVRQIDPAQKKKP